MWTNATRDLVQSTTFIKLIQQQGLNMNLEAVAAGNRQGTFVLSMCRRSSVQTATGQESSAHWVSWRGCGLRWEGRISPHPFTPGPQAWWGCKPAGAGAAHPSLFQTCSECHSDAPARASGPRLRINETSNYVHLLQGIVASNDPHISECPHLLCVLLEQAANYKKVIPEEDTWKRPQKGITEETSPLYPGVLSTGPTSGACLAFSVTW